MSILIRDMEMPKDIEPGLVIEFADGIDGKRYARLYHYRHGGLTEWLEAVPVPPHGRLAVRGKWIWDDEGYHCSECFYHAYGETGEVLSGHWHYCPNCGADMREES